jgi:DNA (cytosine-5)-methyltransferase 1
MTNRMPKAISLFAGAGGCSYGFTAAGYDVVYATDFNRSAIETYKANFQKTPVECRDITELDFNEILRNVKLSPGELDVLIGGPPCQGFSTAGPRFWDDPRNHLLKQYLRALDTIKPKWFLMENVEGILTSAEGKYINEILQAFITLGYSIRLEKVYSHEYGVPQRRKRVIIVGNRLGIDFDFPRPVSTSYGKIYRNSEITLKHALFGLPKPASENKELKYSNNLEGHWTEGLKSSSGLFTEHFAPTLDSVQLERISLLKEGQTMKDLPEHLQHASFKKRSNRRVMDGTPSEKRGGAPSGLKRLTLNEPSLTITSAAIREFVHPLEDRYLTLRECARIQTFPDDFIFCGNNSEKIQQIGNAIPPALARIFGEHIKMLGFEIVRNERKGELLDFILTKSEGLSPALQRTRSLLFGLMPNTQLNIFDRAS